METMHAAGRRTLPPVPRPTAERATAATEATDKPEPPTERFVVDLTTGEQRAVTADDPSDDVPDDVAVAAPGDDVEEAAVPAAADGTDDREECAESAAGESGDLDPAQGFVTRLRTAAADFAEAAGAASAVVREAVPPARHRRARCRVILRYADAPEADVTFLGPAGRPELPSRHGFDRQIRRWLADGQRREETWLVTDPDAQDGLAVDLSAWIAAA